MTDALAPFDDEERALFAARAETLGLRLLPRSMARTPEGTEVWPLFRVIAARLPGEAEAVLILSHMHEGDDPWARQTTATLMRPARQEGADTP